MIGVGCRENWYIGMRGMCRGVITKFMGGIMDVVSKGFREAEAEAEAMDGCDGRSGGRIGEAKKLAWEGGGPVVVDKFQDANRAGESHDPGVHCSCMKA